MTEWGWDAPRGPRREASGIRRRVPGREATNPVTARPPLGTSGGAAPPATSGRGNLPVARGAGRARCSPAPICSPGNSVPQRHARPVAVGVKEHDPGSLEGGADRCDGGGTRRPLALFEVNKRGPRYARPIGNLTLFQTYKGASCAALSRCHALESDLKSDVMSDNMSDNN